MLRRPMCLGLCLLISSLGCSANNQPDTGILLELRFAASLALDRVDVNLEHTTGVRSRSIDRHLASPTTLLLIVPDSWAGNVTVSARAHSSSTLAAEGTAITNVVRGSFSSATIELRAPCSDACAAADHRCFADGIVSCVVGSDGCRQWSAAEPCPPEMPYCSSGQCGAACSDECASGERRCLDDQHFASCGQHDNDTCLDWSAPTSCSAGEACRDQGSCVALCGGEPCACKAGETQACADLGRCHGGRRECVAGAFGSCQWQTGPIAEQCNGEDDDCDTSVDETTDLNAPNCDKQLGVCKGARQRCGGKSGWLNCDASDYAQHAQANGKVYQVEETACDNVDNDCDGQVDEHPNCNKPCVPQCGTASCGKSDGCNGTCTVCFANATCKSSACYCDFGNSCGAQNCCGEADVCRDTTCEAPVKASWLITAGGEADEQVNDLVIDSQGNVVIVGTFGSEMTVGSTTLKRSVSNGLVEAFVIKLDPQGKVSWAQAFTISNNNADIRAEALAIDAQDNIFVGGHFSGQGATARFGSLSASTTPSKRGYVVKLDRSGQEQWLQVTSPVGSGASASVAALTIDGQGEVLAAGTFSTSLEIGGKQIPSVSTSKDDAFVVKLANSDGAGRWLLYGGGSGFDRISGVATNAANEIFVAGKYDTYATFGSIVVSTPNRDGGFLGKISPSGGWQWLVTTLGGGETLIQPADVAATSDGGAVVAGSFSLLSSGAREAAAGAFKIKGSVERRIYLIKVDKGGAVTWATSAIGSNEAHRLSPSGNQLLLAAVLRGGSLDGISVRDAYSSGAALALVLDPQTGKFAQILPTGTGPGSAVATSVAKASNGALVLGGYFEDKAFFGSTAVSSKSGSRDLFVVRLNP